MCGRRTLPLTSCHDAQPRCIFVPIPWTMPLSPRRSAAKQTQPSLAPHLDRAQNTVRLGGVSLPRQARRADKVVAQAAASPAPAEPKKFLGFPALTWAKIVPLGLMFFSILFNYTILRDTKVRLYSAK